MPAVEQRAVRVNGLDGLIRAFNAADKDVKTDLVDTLRAAAGPVKADAQSLAGSRIHHMGGASRPWAQMRIGGSKVIWVAPVERGRNSKRRGRKNLANLMMDRALQPALDQNIGRVEKAVEELLDDIANVWERTHQVATRKLEVEIVGDSASLERAFDRSSRSAKNFENQAVPTTKKLGNAFEKLSKVAAFGFVGGAAASAAVAGIKTTINAASDLNEQITKNQQVFGSSAKAVEAWSKTTAQSIGVSQQAALGATGTFGNLFTAIGISNKPAADMSTRLVKLAADLASFNNASIEDTLDAIRSGLVGETEPMRRYGVLLSAARVQQEALTETGKSNVKQLTEQEKAVARVNLIFKDTVKAQGDFERTSGGLANQQRILAADIQDLEANIGTLLLPTITKFTGVLVDATEGATEMLGVLTKLGKIRIPPIKIPFFFDVPGGGLTDVAGKAFDIAKLTPLNPLMIETIAAEVAGQFQDKADEQVPILESQFEKTIGGLIDSSLAGVANKGIDVTPPPININFTDLLFNVGIPGFATGATPEDILGPQIKDLPKKIQEALLDAEIAGDPKDIKAVLQRQKKILVDALSDPRGLTADERIKIKNAEKGIISSIEGIDKDAAQARKAAATARQKRIDDAAKKAKADADKQKKAFGLLLENLQVTFDRDEAAKRFGKLKADSKAIEKAIQDQIKIEGRTPTLVRALFEQRQVTAQAVKDQQQAAQNKALGLTREGDEIIPGMGNLKKQFEQLGARIDPALLSSKLRKTWAGVGRLLRGDLGKLTDETRGKIRDYFRDVRAEWDKGDILHISPATQALNKNAIVQGLGLDRDTERLIKSRLSGFNRAGRRLNPAPGTSGAFGITITPQPVHVNTTVNLDGQKVANNTTIHQGKNKRSNPAQKRGPLRNI